MFRDKRDLIYDKSDCLNFYEGKIKGSKRYLGITHIQDYYIAILSFIEYIYDTMDKQLMFTGYDVVACKVVSNIVDYNHRWSKVYVNRMLARLYNLDLHNIKNVTMLTMTTYQDSDYAFKMTGKRYTINDSFELLIESRAKLIQLLRNYYPDLQYLWVMEPHDSGYPHCHMIIFNKLTSTEKIHLKKMWSKKYNAGNYIHGLNIRDVQGIRSIRNYLMKYMKKSIMFMDLTKADVPLGLLAYHAVARDGGYRFIGCSSEVSKAMNPDLVDNDKNEVIWYKVGVVIKTRMWSDDSTEYHDCSISQEKYELALEKLEQTRNIYAGLSVMFDDDIDDIEVLKDIEVNK